MSLIPDIFKKDPDKSFIVNYTPIFALLSFLEKDLIIQKSKVVEYSKGDVVYRQSDSPDAFYCVITGRIRISTRKPEGSGAREEILEYLNCGKYFGLISVLTGEAHSVNASVVNDSKILRIDKEDFHFLLNKIPRLAIDLSRTLSRRLRKKDLKEKKIFESNIISVFSAAGHIGRTVYAANLAVALRRETSRNVILVDISATVGEACRVLGLLDFCQHSFIGLNTALASESVIKDAIFTDPSSGVNVLNVMHDSQRPDYGASLNALLTFLTGSYHYIIVDLSVSMDVAVFQALNQSDIIHIITDCKEDNLKLSKNLVADLYTKVNYPQEKIKVIVSAGTDDVISSSEASKILDYKIYAYFPAFQEFTREVNRGRIALDYPLLEYSRALRRIAREIGDVRVGLALGGGAAFGLAHVGVIKVLEREGLAIDMVSASSMGALVGAMWAIGLSGKRIEEIMMEYSNDKKKVFRLLVDPCFPKLSLVKGGRIRDFLNKHLGDKTFRDTKFPFKIVACNLTKREEFVFSSGKLVDAVMASIAIPGVYAPAQIKGDIIIDGGIAEPVPIGTLVKMGIKKIIAVNVLPSPRDVAISRETTSKRHEEESWEVKKKGIFGRISYIIGNRFSRALWPNILDIIVSSIQTLEYTIAESDCQKADVVVNPIVPGVEWFEFFKVDALIKKGESEAENSLSSIRNIINE